MSFGDNGYIRADISNSMAIQAGSSSTVGWQVRTSDNATAKLSMSGTGGTSLALEGATPVTGTGITFPATQSASSNANTLDDYEEGTWTPVLKSDTTSPTVGYSVQVGFYTKIGRVVTLCGRVSTSSISGGSGSAYIDGLPFAAGATNNPFPGALEVSEITFSAGKTYVNNRILTGSVQMAFSQVGSAGGAIGIPIGSFASACDLVFSCVYFV